MARLNRPVVVLAGGTGGAKLARGMLDVAGGELVVIANTADDIEIHDAHVSPDPDLVSYWLADRIDARGWGIEGDTWNAVEELRAAGTEVWFNLGDEDLRICRRRLARLRAGARLTETLAELSAELGHGAKVLPMSDDPLRTVVTAHGREWPFQEFMIRGRAEGPVDAYEFRGAEAARATPEVLAALAGARAIVIGPSNPIVSIGPILAVAGVRDALRTSSAPVVAVSPIVGGAVLKGPTEVFMASAGLPASGEGVASFYDGLLDGFVADEAIEGLPYLRTDTLMGDPAARRRVASEALGFALALRDR